jgi:ankyrin repeat protein
MRAWICRHQAGDTPLLYACIKNHIRVVEELKKAGADLSVKGMVCRSSLVSKRSHTAVL